MRWAGCFVLFNPAVAVAVGLTRLLVFDASVSTAVIVEFVTYAVLGILASVGSFGDSGRKKR